ncbi:cysteine--tRNA ligase, cytoplasmic [Diaphorina citri]|uniref:Cysteine--tRNA ligase, cytoplasmic n=1 Tax=Diaphorina citri TaxID=121845 RepID=A0A1S3DLE4_DIACI|nr:cysteine--tRNA ligase, cytoplasmic [Diaphorina citri]
MSKSLKNFITIQDALNKHTARQLRLAFLLHAWHQTLDYSDNTMEMAVTYEKLLNEFFLNVKDHIRNLKFPATTVSSFEKWTQADLELSTRFIQTKNNVHAALCDNMDTRSALDSIRDCISQVNIYLRGTPNQLLLRDIGAYVTKILTVFGCIGDVKNIGFPLGGTGVESTNLEELVLPYLTILSEFRDNIRTEARLIKSTEILNQCDRLRDEVLPNVGVRLEDIEGKNGIYLFPLCYYPIRRSETVRCALDVLNTCAVLPRAQLLLCQQVELPEDTPIVGMNIVLSAAEGEIVSDPDVQRAALYLLITCIYAPLKNQLGPPPTPKTPTSTPSSRKSSQLALTPKPSSKSLDEQNVVTNCVRSNNGIMVLLNLMTIKTPITDADSIRGLACRALAGLATHETVRQIMSKF